MTAKGLEDDAGEWRPGASLLLPPLFCFAAVLMLALILSTSHGARGGGTGDFPPPPAGDWTVDEYTSVWNETMVLHGNVIVLSGGTLNVTGVNISFSCVFQGQYKMIVQDGGALFMTMSSVDATDAEKQYSIVFEHGSVGVVSETGITHAGWPGGAPGIRISSDTVYILDSVISYASTGLSIVSASPRISGNAILDSGTGIEVLNGAMPVISGNDIVGNIYGIAVTASEPEIKGNKVTENVNIGIVVMSSDLEMVNNTVTACGVAGVEVSHSNILFFNGSVRDQRVGFHLTDRSNVTAVNTSFVLVELKIEDTESVFHYYVFASIEVVWWSNLSGVDGARLDLYDRYWYPSGNATTGQDGFVDLFLLHIFDMTLASRTDLWPHTVNASKGDRTASGTLTDTYGWRLRLVLDDIDPLLTVKAPVERGFVNTSTFTVHGTAWDNETGLTSVEVLLDAGTWLAANGTDTWGLNLTAEDGTHTIIVRARDMSRNERYVMVNLTVDTLPPWVNITSPRDGLVVNRTWAEVRGTAGDDLTNISVWVAGRPVPFDTANGTFAVNLTLEEGANLVRVDVFDEAGNWAWATVEITRDTTVSPFDILPVNNTALNVTNITMHGDIEPFAKMRINGTNITAGNGTFKFNMSLKEGDNIIFVEAWDAYGNYRNGVFHYTVDTVPPILNITSPPTLEVHTRDPGVNIKGFTEDGATVTLNGRELMLFNNHFSQRVEVVEGENAFVMTATDQAGNSVTKVIWVFVDRTPPFINITSPPQDQRIRGMYVHITGLTEPNSTVTVDGIQALVNPDGTFEAYANMKCGSNTYTIEAKDRAGNAKKASLRVERVDRDRDDTDKWVAIGLLTAGAVVYIAFLLWQANRNGYLDPVKRLFGEMKESAKETKDVALVGSERPGEERSVAAPSSKTEGPKLGAHQPHPLMIAAPETATPPMEAIPPTPQPKAKKAEMEELKALMTEREAQVVKGPTKAPAEPKPEKPAKPDVGPFRVTPQGRKVRIGRAKPAARPPPPPPPSPSPRAPPQARGRPRPPPRGRGPRRGAR